MIFLWDRREVYQGTSSIKFFDIRNILNLNDIRYTHKIKNRQTPSVLTPERNLMGSLGQKVDYSYTYYLYVHKDDYDLAIHLINKHVMI